ncbi:SUN domain-containing protein 1-like [Sitophilus oryzae]|uniref:SUN domain-containing protein 1-like n=1 Tax=Sitophilus oryzae TaxID=7048 RepID=A0A6J2XAG2_SITOR|nr:SUN domain-containing protein 1-like [Sitophilus oryzae]
MYGEPDLVDLLPAYYCNYMMRSRQNPSIWKTICTHIFVIIITSCICIGIFYYYQNIYLQNHIFPQSEHEELTKTVEYDTPKPSSPPAEAFIDLNNQITKLRKDFDSIKTWRSDINAAITKIEWEQDIKIRHAVTKELDIHSADDVGLLDYAATYSGGSIAEISPETRPYPTHKPLSFFKLVNLDLLSSPDEIIRPCNLPGSCFAFWGSTGSIKIRLGRSIEVGSVTLSHASRLLLGLQGVSSAPKQFAVQGHVSDKDKSGTYLGRFTYNSMGKQHQIFQIEKRHTDHKKFELVTLTILSNYGNEEFTCVYRFRVHERALKQADATLTSKKKPEKEGKCC